MLQRPQTPAFEPEDDDRDLWDVIFDAWHDCDPAALGARRWIYGRHFLEGAVSTTIADGGVGKSTLALTEAIVMVTGRPLLGIAPNKEVFPDGYRDRRRVLYYNAEERLEKIKRRVFAICQHFEIDPGELKTEPTSNPWRSGGSLTIVSGHDYPLVTFSAANPPRPGTFVLNVARLPNRRAYRDRDDLAGAPDRALAAQLASGRGDLDPRPTAR